MKKYGILLSVLLSLIVVSSACSPQNTAQTTPSRPKTTPAAKTARPPTKTPTPTEVVVHGTVRIWHSWDESEMPAFDQIVRGFNAIYPDVLFDVLYVPSQDLQARYTAEVGEGGGPNLLLGPAEWGLPLYDAGLVKDLTGDISTETLQALNQPASGAGHYKGALIGLPYSISGIVLYRNKDIITLPAHTFDELVTLAQTSTHGDKVGADLERSFFYSGGHLIGIGGQLMDANGQPAFNDAKGLEWTELLKDFEKAGPTTYYNDQDLDYFKAGKVGWIIDGTWNLGALADALGNDKLAIDPWPTYGSGRLAGYVLAENLYLNPHTAGNDLEATQKFIEYFLSAEAQAYLAEVGRIPANQTVVLADTTPNGKLIAQAITALAEGATYPVTPAMQIYNVNMDIALKSIFTGKVPAAQALQTANDEILKELSAAQTTPTPAP